MSENKHTPEPWAIDPDDRPNMHWNNHIVSEANPNIAICFMAHDGTEQNERGEANARRIVACINACAGCATEALETAPVGFFNSTYGHPKYLEEITKQRDELLAALERFMDSHEECTDFDGFTAQIVSMADYHQAQEAIESVKGD